MKPKRHCLIITNVFPLVNLEGSHRTVARAGGMGRASRIALSRA